MADKWPVIQSLVRDTSCQPVYWLWQAARGAGRLILTQVTESADASLCKLEWDWSPSPLTNSLGEAEQQIQKKLTLEYKNCIFVVPQLKTLGAYLSLAVMFSSWSSMVTTQNEILHFYRQHWKTKGIAKWLIRALFWYLGFSFLLN